MKALFLYAWRRRLQESAVTGSGPGRFGGGSRRWRLGLGLGLLAVGMALPVPAQNPLLPSPYSPSGWPCQHHDPRNSDWMPIALPEFVPQTELPTVRWILRETNNPTVEMVVGSVARDGTNEVLYVTTGKVGAPNLYAFRTSDGAELWHSTPAAGAVSNAGPNSAALTSSVTLDKYGRMFLADSKYLYCYTTGMNLDTQGNRPFLWRTVLPHLKVFDSGSGTWVASANDADPTAFAKPFLSLVFSREIGGRYFVGGITIAGDVFFFNPTNGTMVAEAHLASPPPPPDTNAPCDPVSLALADDPMKYDKTGATADPYMPFGIWCTGSTNDHPDLDYFMNPCQLQVYLEANTGGTGTMVANTPVLIPDSLNANVSRLYVCAAQSEESAAASSDTNRNDAIVYRVDFDPTQLIPTNRLKVMNYQYVLGQPRFNGRMPNGENSATSPDISPNDRWLFTADRNGYLYCFDVNDGSRVWRWEIGTSMGSPTTFQNPDAQGRFKLFCFGDYQLHVFEIDSLTGNVATNLATGEAFHRVLDFEKHFVQNYWRKDQPAYDDVFRTSTGVPFERVAEGACYMVGTSNRVLAVYTVGWHNPQDPKGIWLIPTHSLVAVVNPAAVWTAVEPEGALEAVYMDTNGTCEVSFIPSDTLPRATIYYGSQSTTFAQYLDANNMMPEAMKPLYLRPFGGARIVELPFSAAANQPPATTILTPANPAYAKPGATILVSGENADPDGRIASFRLLTNGVPMTAMTLSGYWQVPWTPSNACTVTFQTEVYDNDGVKATSSPVTISVSPDSDGDGLPDAQEIAWGTSTNLPDTDADGFLDGVEVAAGTNPKSASDLPRLAAPRFDPPPGTYPQNLLVTLSNAAPGSVLRYTRSSTIEGVLPTTNSPVFTPGAWMVITNHATGTNDPNPMDTSVPLTPVSLTILAQAFQDGVGVSTVVTGKYVLNKLQASFGQVVSPPPKEGSTKHQVDVYHPVGRTNNRVVVFIYGGAWKQGDKDMYLELGNTLAGFYGLTTVIVNYRVSDTNDNAIFPDHILDVRDAFTWTYTNIWRFGGDSNRLFLFGQSAGAHLGSLLVTDTNYLATNSVPISAVKGMVSMSGAYRLSQYVQETDNPLGMTPPEILMYEVICYNTFTSTAPAVLDPASPAMYVRPHQPPFHLIYAWQDMPGMGVQCQDFYAQLQASNAPVSLLKLEESDIPPLVAALGYPFGGHYTEIYAVNTRDWDSLSTRTVVDFIDRIDPQPDPPAAIRAVVQSDQLTLTWPMTRANLFLESTTNLAGAATWQPVRTLSTLGNNQHTLRLPLTDTRRFFRLRSY